MSPCALALALAGPLVGFALGRWSARGAPARAVRRLAELVPDLSEMTPAEAHELDMQCSRSARRAGFGHQPASAGDRPPTPPPTTGSAAKPPPPRRVEVTLRRAPPPSSDD